MYGKTAAELDLDNSSSAKAQGEADQSRPDDHASFPNHLSLHTELEDTVLLARQELDVSSNKPLIIKHADASLSEHTTQQQDILSLVSHAVLQGVQEAMHELERVLLLNTHDSVTRRTVIAQLLGIPSVLSAWDEHFIKSLTEAMLFSEQD